MSDDDEKLAEVITLRPRGSEVLPYVSRKPRDYTRQSQRCEHARTLFDAHDRTLECADCGCEVDPFYVFDRQARHSGDIASHVKLLREERRVLLEEIEGLKIARRNLRAQVKRAGGAA